MSNYDNLSILVLFDIIQAKFLYYYKEFSELFKYPLCIRDEDLRGYLNCALMPESQEFLNYLNIKVAKLCDDLVNDLK